MTVTLDIERLAAAIRYIDGNPLRWFQGSWGRLFIPEEIAQDNDIFVDIEDPLGEKLGQPRSILESWYHIPESVKEACQTAFCVAGWVTHQAIYVDKQIGVKEYWNDGKDTLLEVTIDKRPYQPGNAAKALLVDLGGYISYWEMPSGPDRDLALDANRVLDEMFGGDNTRADIQHYAENFALLAGVEWPVSLPDWADPEDTSETWYKEEGSEVWSTTN